jgi:hypothetical protein
VVAAIRTVRKLDSKPPGSYNIRHVLKAFNDRLSFRDMCVVLKEQRGWRPAIEFFAWMKLQVHHIVFFCLVLRACLFNVARGLWSLALGLYVAWIDMTIGP